jgi:Family of unknown function (DUF6311)
MSSTRTASGPEASHPICLLIACIVLVILVAILAVVSFPQGFLDGSAAFWRYPILDYAQHTIGGRYFIADAWRWPLLIVPDLGTPPGTNIGLTDSIPIAAMAVKLLRGWYGYERPYLPMWIVLCYLLQGPACAIALYVLGVRHVAALVLGGLIAVFTPILLFRFAHAALCAQFLLLLALALHLYVARATSRRVNLVHYLPLLLLALLVHIYLFAMLFAIMLASLLQGLWTERLTIPAALAQLAIMALVIGVVMWACGYFDLGPIPMKPYGQWALDLAAPFFPAPSVIFGVAELPRDRPGEDFAWLGAGMVVLLIAALVGWWRQLGSMARAHLPTLVICGLLIIFAVTYVVRIGPVLVLGMGPERVRQAVLFGAAHGGTLHTLIGSLDAMDYLRIGAYGAVLFGLAALVVIRAWQWRKLRFLRFIGLVLLVVAVVLAVRPSAIPLILSNFQSSARFVWPVIYLTNLLAIAGVWRAYSPRIAVSLMVVALVLQVLDTMPVWRAMRYDADFEPHPLPEEPVLLSDMVKADRVTFVPTYLCAYAEPLDTDARDVAIAHLTDLEVLVSRFVRPTNSVRNSRMTATDIEGLRGRCDGERREAQANLDTPGTMTLVLNDTPMEAQLRADLSQRSGCSRLSTATVCVGR